MTRVELRQDWQARISEFRDSGLSAAEWCDIHEVNLHTLRYWLRQFPVNKSVPAVASSTKWLSVRIDEQVTADEDSLVVGIGQTRIEVRPGFNASLLADIVRTLTNLC